MLKQQSHRRSVEVRKVKGGGSTRSTCMDQQARIQMYRLIVASYWRIIVENSRKYVEMYLIGVAPRLGHYPISLDCSQVICKMVRGLPRPREGLITGLIFQFISNSAI